MHWFWRAAIAVAVSASYMKVSFIFILNSLNNTVTWYARGGQIEDRISNREVFSASAGIVYGVPVAIITLAAYALATRLFGPKPHDGELRCRKCSYILRGLTEPRCPECGEGI